MRHVLAALVLQLATLPPATDRPRAAADAPAAPAARWAYVSAYVTVPSARSARRIKVVTAVFALCDDRELPSMIFAAADSSLRAAVRRSTRAPFTITHRGLEVRTSRDSAEAARRRGLDDERFAQTLDAALDAALGVACCCER